MARPSPPPRRRPRPAGAEPLLHCPAQASAPRGAPSSLPPSGRRATAWRRWRRWLWRHECGPPQPGPWWVGGGAWREGPVRGPAWAARQAMRGAASATARPRAAPPPLPPPAGTHEYHKKVVERIRRLNRDKGYSVAVMVGGGASCARLCWVSAGGAAPLAARRAGPPGAARSWLCRAVRPYRRRPWLPRCCAALPCRLRWTRRAARCTCRSCPPPLKGRRRRRIRLHRARPLHLRRTRPTACPSGAAPRLLRAVKARL